MALSRVERFVVLLLRLVSRACLAVLGLLPAPAPPRAASPAPARAVPPPRSALLLLPARELARRLRLRQVRGGGGGSGLCVVSGSRLRSEPRAAPADRPAPPRCSQVKCVEVVETYIERIREVNPLINAVVKDR